MNNASKTLVLGLAAALTLTTITLAQGRHARGAGTPPRASATQGGEADGHRRGNRAERRFERRQHVRQFARSLEFTDAQRAQALAAAKAVAPVAESARAEARKIVAEARAAHPDATRAELRDLVKGQLGELKQRTRAQIQPQGQALVGALSAEQRAKIQAALEKRGRTFDEERLARRMSFLLARPNAVPFLERRAHADGNRTR